MGAFNFAPMNGLTKISLKTIALHTLGIVAFLMIPLVMMRGRPGDSFLENPIAQKELLVFLFLLIFFYLNYYWWIPAYYLQQRWLAYSMLLIISYPIISLLPSVLLFGGFAPPVPRRPHDNEHVLVFELTIHFFHFLVVTLLSLSIKINEQLKLVREQQIRAELDYLRSQINPHFLFNTLNSIYALSLKSDSRTPEAIVKLSGMMRYVFTETDNKRVSLEQEINHIDDYISLQSLRLGDTVDLQYHKSGDFSAFHIAPLLLIPFIENAFKHGILPGIRSRIEVEIKVEQGWLTLVTSNYFRARPLPDEQTGIGLANTLTRLELLYPGQYQLDQNKQGDNFIIRLKISLS